MDDIVPCAVVGPYEEDAGQALRKAEEGQRRGMGTEGARS
jgi:hypothetical protein